MKNIFVLILICAGISLNAQSGKEKRANKKYERLAYSKAARMYEELSSANRLSDNGKKHLGDCYRLTGQWGRAEKPYGELANGAAPTAEIVYYYAQALRFNGKYAESNVQMARFHQMQGGDTRAKEFNSDPEFITKIQSQEPYFDITNLNANSSNSDFGPAFRNGKVVFASARPFRVSKQNFHTWNGSPFLDMYEASRETDGQLNNVQLLNAKVSTKFHEGPSCFTADGNTMYFTRNNYFNGKYAKSSKGVNNLKIFRAKWNGTSWNEENLVINSDEYSVGHPALSPDGAWLYYASDMPGGKGETDIYRVAINSDGSLGTPENLAGNVNTEGKEMFPFVDKNGNLFFASDGHIGLGGLDVFYAPADGKGSFGKLVNPGMPLNSSYDDFGFVLDDESQSGYLSSNRPGGKGDDDIYFAKMLRPLKPVYMLKGIAREKGSGAILAGAIIVLKDNSGKAIDTVVTGIDGSYAFPVEPKLNYSLGGTKEKYFDAAVSLNTNELGEKTELLKDIDLDKDPGLSLYVTVKDKATGLPLDSVKIKILDNMTGGEFGNTVTSTAGDYRNPISGKKIGDRLSYNVSMERNGYLAKTVTLNTPIEKEGEIRLDENLDKIAVGLDLAKIIDIKPIYFDLGKHAIRPDAAIELDKIVKVMNENPNMVVELGSHTDCRSSAASNMALSDRRAKASAEYIKKRITNPERIYGKGYGETQLTNGCECEGAVKSTCSEEEHQENRRTEFKIIKM
jgi:outer membrane protein OmpA-like peptidoglycan-associated protein